MKMTFQSHYGRSVHYSAGPGRGGGGRPQGRGVEGAGQVPAYLQHLQGHEEGRAPVWQSGQGGQGVCAGMCLRVHLIYHKVCSTYA